MESERNRRFWKFCIGGLLVLTAACSTPRSAGPHHAGIVVSFGDGRVETRCVEFTEPTITSAEALSRSGLQIATEDRKLGHVVCRIEGIGCDHPSEPCFCQCKAGEPCRFWGEWHFAKGGWQFAKKVSSQNKLRDGGLLGLVWGVGAADRGTPPPVKEFSEICQSSAGR